MFEDSLMESGHTNKAISKYWPIVSLLVNGGTLIVILMWPLFHPEALPSRMIATLMQAPPPPLPPSPLATASKVPIKSEAPSIAFEAPSRIPRRIRVASESAVPPSFGVMEGMGRDTPGAMDSILRSGTAPVRFMKQTAGTVSISSRLMAGNLLEKALPQYPTIAREARVQGTVVLQATISGAGLISNLRVISGPPLLQQAAVDAVRSWRYKPYLLNGQPVEVETTINVVFNLGQ